MFELHATPPDSVIQRGGGDNPSHDSSREISNLKIKNTSIGNIEMFFGTGWTSKKALNPPPPHISASVRTYLRPNY